MKKMVIDKNVYEKYQTIVQNRKNQIKKVLTVLLCVLLLCSLIVSMALKQFIDSDMGFLSFAVSAGIILLVYLVMWIPCVKYQNAIENYDDAKQKEKEFIEETLRKQQVTDEQNIIDRLDQIKKTIIIGTHTQKDSADTIDRGIAGGILFGVVGAVVGTASAKDRTYTTFLIIFNDDTRMTYTVETGSTLYNYFTKFIEA